MKPNKIIQEVFGGKSRMEVEENNKNITPNQLRESIGLQPIRNDEEITYYCDNKEVLKINGGNIKK